MTGGFKRDPAIFGCVLLYAVENFIDGTRLENDGGIPLKRIYPDKLIVTAYS